MEGRKKKRREGRGEEWRGKEDGREREDTVHMIVIRAVVKNKGGGEERENEFAVLNTWQAVWGSVEKM